MTPILSRGLLLVPLLVGLAQGALYAQGPADSVVYHLDPGSRLVVKTGKAGLFGFAGHAHVIRARSMTGELVYRPDKRASHLRIKVPTDSLEVLTPPDTAEIRKVTEAMRTQVLHVDKYPEMTFAADSLDAKSGKMDMQLAVTMEGTTRKVPVTANVVIGKDGIRAGGTFVAKQTDFGIVPFKGGPGGTVKVADEVTFCFDLIATREKTAGAAAQVSSANDPRGVPGCVDNSSETPDRRPM
jgi:polyisoprenoid-binding protein YceI